MSHSCACAKFDLMIGARKPLTEICVLFRLVAWKLFFFPRKPAFQVKTWMETVLTLLLLFVCKIFTMIQDDRLILVVTMTCWRHCNSCVDSKRRIWKNIRIQYDETYCCVYNRVIFSYSMGSTYGHTLHIVCYG